MLLAVIGLVIVGWSWSKLGGITDYWVDQGKKWQIINLLLEHIKIYATPVTKKS